MSKLCTKKGVPHKNWFIKSWYDNGSQTVLCNWCGTQHVRYVHIMDHKNYKPIEVGCDCAETISAGYKGKEVDKEMKKAAKEKKRLESRVDSYALLDMLKGVTGMSLKQRGEIIRAAGWKIKEFTIEEYRIYNERLIT